MSWFLAPALVRLRAEINALWPDRDRSSDGSVGDTSHAARASDHNPDRAAGGIVRAIDVDEDLVVGLAATGEAMPLVEQIIADPRVAYVIYEGRIWQRPGLFSRSGWMAYSGINAHRHHVHVSVRRGTPYDSDARPWGITRATSAPTTIPVAPAPVPPPAPTPAPVTPAPLTPTSEEDDMLPTILWCYEALLGRKPAPREVIAAASDTAGRQTGGIIAWFLAARVDGEPGAVRAAYLEYLGREPAPAEIPQYAGLTVAQMRAKVAGSQEAIARVGLAG